MLWRRSSRIPPGATFMAPGAAADTDALVIDRIAVKEVSAAQELLRLGYSAAPALPSAEHH